MQETNLILGNKTEFLKYLRSKFTMIHQSNFFFRDFHYGVMSYLNDNDLKVRYVEAEAIAREVGATLERDGIFRRIDHQSWLVNYPEFALPRVEKKAS